MKLTILLGHLSLLVTYSNAGLPSSTTTIKRDLVPDEACVDSSLKFRVEDDTSISYKSCKWVKDKITQRCSIEGVRLHCPKSCNTCGTHKCEDGELSFKYETGSKTKKTTCNVINRNTSKCAINGVSEVCRSSCEYCALPPDSLQDSKYKFKLKGSRDHFKCSDLAIDENDLCNDQDVQSHCPVTCGSPKMCRDSQVKFKTKQNGFKYCWTLDNICDNLDGRLTCRSTCGVCNPVAPSQPTQEPLFSLSPSSIPSQAPTCYSGIGLGIIDNIPNNSCYNLKACAGHCIDNDMCRDDLICFNPNLEVAHIPGCIGIGLKNYNYCIEPVTPSQPTQEPSSSLSPTSSPSYSF